jgi:cobalamin synthase
MVEQFIPARVPAAQRQREVRKFLTYLPTRDYIRFEEEAAARDVTVFELAGRIIKAWLAGLPATSEQESA